MDRLLAAIRKESGNRPFQWTPREGDAFAGLLPAKGMALAIAPHPSDAERAAIFLSRLKDSGWEVRNAICTKGVAGVLDRYVISNGGGKDFNARKSEIRRAEAFASARLFGIGEDCVTFLYDCHCEVGRGDPKKDAEAIEVLLKEVAPDIVSLPSGNDENATHVGVWRAFRGAASARPTGKPLVAFYHEDPKTISMKPDLLVWFDRQGSLFKSKLLIAHDSQQQRRIERSGEGLDDRILQKNFERAQSYRREVADAPDLPFAEAFEIEIFD